MLPAYHKKWLIAKNIPGRLLMRVQSKTPIRIIFFLLYRWFITWLYCRLIKIFKTVGETKPTVSVLLMYYFIIKVKMSPFYSVLVLVFVPLVLSTIGKEVCVNDNTIKNSCTDHKTEGFDKVRILCQFLSCSSDFHSNYFLFDLKINWDYFKTSINFVLWCIQILYLISICFFKERRL